MNLIDTDSLDYYHIIRLCCYMTKPPEVDCTWPAYLLLHRPFLVYLVVEYEKAWVPCSWFNLMQVLRLSLACVLFSIGGGLGTPQSKNLQWVLYRFSA